MHVGNRCELTNMLSPPKEKSDKQDSYWSTENS